MDIADLARRLGTTTLFSRLTKAQLLDLLHRSPLNRSPAGVDLLASENGLRHHLLLLEGSVEATRTWLNQDGQHESYAWQLDANIGPSGFALLSPSSRNIRVRTLTDSVYLALDATTVDEMLDRSAAEANGTLPSHLTALLSLPVENVHLALERMQERSVMAGETIVRQGEPGDGYYIIRSGEAEVWVTDPLTDETSRVAVLSDNDAFGEEALLLGGNRTATVTMNTPGSLLTLSKSDFDELLRPNRVNEVDAMQARAMLQSGEAKLIDCRYDMEFEESRIPGALLVPLSGLRREGVFELDSDQLYIVYCRSGRRSSAAAFLLTERGFRVMSLKGGLQDWPFEVDDAPIAP